MRALPIAVIGAMSAAAVSGQPTSEPVATGSAASNDVATIVESCSAHKFETIVSFTAEGKKHQSKVKLCGQAGQTDAQWAATLRDAAKKLQTNSSMPPEAREQAVTAINAEILKLESGSTVLAKSGTKLTLPRETAKITGISQGAPAGRLPEYSSLPPLPAPTTIAAAAASTLASAPAAPRMTIRCLLPSDNGAAGSCATMEKGTQISVRADEDLPAGVRLRFLRKGSDRGEVALSAMRMGQIVKVIPPARLCTGVVRSSAEIEVVTPGASSAPVQRLGPYELVC